jgi:ABC-2 type transport system permease protein
MTWALVRKLLRDILLAWFVAALLLFLFQLIWARLTQRVTSQIIAEFQRRGISPELLEEILFKNNELSGQLVQAIIGGDNIQLNHAPDMMSISYVHPLLLTILCIWASGRAANAIAGEIDRGTLELLMAQPIRRTQIIVAHLLVDAIVFPALCLILWTGTYNGTWWMGLQSPLRGSPEHVDPLRFFPALTCVLALLFSVSGMTMWISSMGRSRARVWGLSVSLLLLMFLVNVLGQIWNDQLEWLRPFTIFYHYQPQGIILQEQWYRDGGVWQHLAVLGSIGAVGYFLAWVTFCRRDLPAPL